MIHDAETFERIINQEKSVLDSVCETYEKSMFDKHSISLDSNSDLSELDNLNMTNVVYVITSMEISQNVIDAFLEYRQKQDKKNNKDEKESLPTDNSLDTCFLENGCLYVGSVTEDKPSAFRDRIRQHIGEIGGKGLAALKVKKWWNEWKLRFTYYSFTPNSFGLPENAEIKKRVRIFEDVIAEMLKPLTGKRGDSPKG